RILGERLSAQNGIEPVISSVRRLKHLLYRERSETPLRTPGSDSLNMVCRRAPAFAYAHASRRKVRSLLTTLSSSLSAGQLSRFCFSRSKTASQLSFPEIVIKKGDANRTH